LIELKEIYKPVESDLKKVEIRLQEVLLNKNRFISTLSNYLLKAPGKHLRPALVLLSSKLGDSKSNQAIDLAAAIELIHTATLIHDDVIDNAEIRRKLPSLNVKFGKDTAILFGDYLYSRAFEIVTVLNIPKVTHVLLHATNAICEGEMRQLSRVFRSIKEKEYLEIISSKTASLFSACCQIGGVVAGVKKQQISNLRKYGHNLGMGFQIVDDCLDLIGDARKIGKGLELDAKCGKMTLPLIYLSQFPKKSKYEAVNYALDVAKNYERQALKAIDVFDENEIKKRFKYLVRYISNRVN
jgi:octaprenyl-diphosphate synthase